jgi:hypothetical protein
MISVTSSAVAALHRQEQERKAREDRMRNALEILAGKLPSYALGRGDLELFVRATAREGLGRETET